MARHGKRNAYQNLEQLFRDLSALSNARNILERDMQTVMPAGSAQDREHQIVTLDKIAHQKLSEPHVSDWLDEAEAGTSGLTEGQRAICGRCGKCTETALPFRTICRQP